jgi:hypothetical protein
MRLISILERPGDIAESNLLGVYVATISVMMGATRGEGGMIGPLPGVRVLVAPWPVDFRKGMDGLAALAQQTLSQDPFSGTVLVFRAKRADRVKLLKRGQPGRYPRFLAIHSSPAFS